MEIKKTIVILYETAVSENIAAALKAQLAANYPDKYVVAVPDNQFIKNDLAKMRRKMRRSFLRSFPTTELFFSKVSSVSVHRRLRKQRHAIKKDHDILPAGKTEKLLGRHLKYVRNIFLRFDPEMVICLTPYCLEMAMSTKAMMNVKTFVTAFVSEMCLDEKFVDYHCDGYYVLNNEVRSALMKLGIGETRINVAGFPPCPEPNDVDELKRKIGLDEKFPCVLLSAGEYEKQHLFPFFQNLTDSCTQFNLVIDARGSNVKKLKKACDLCVAREHVFIIEDMDPADLIAACDILVTTPETDRLFLAFGYEKPVIITPAQTLFQRQLVNYLSERNVVMLADTPEHFSQMLLGKLDEFTELTEMAKRASTMILDEARTYCLNAPSKIPDHFKETTGTAPVTDISANWPADDEDADPV